MPQVAGGFRQAIAPAREAHTSPCRIPGGSRHIATLHNRQAPPMRIPALCQNLARRVPKRVAAGAGTAVLLLALFFLLAPYYSTHLLWGLRLALPFLIPLVILAAAVAFLGLVAAWRYDAGRSYKLWTTAAVTAGVLSLAGFIAWCITNTYLREHQYAATVQATDAPVPELTQRAPFQVAAAQARVNLGDNPGDLVDTTYLATEDTYTSLVERRGWFTGYSTALVQHVPLTGRATGTTCDFSTDADSRIGGALGGNLGRRINELERGVSWDADDVYGYCAPDPAAPGARTPMVVVPLTEQDGFFVITERPAGIALYNGKTDQLTIRTDTTGIPGPAYPLSLAATQRESSIASGSFADWLSDRSGWETTDDDTNSGNAAEFNLADTHTKQPLYVTPLTGRGSATAISAISVVDARTAAPGYAAVVVHRLARPWVNPDSITSRIKKDTQDLPNWQNLKVMEVAPLSGERWVATIGDNNIVSYRVRGTGTLTDPDPKSTQAADPNAQPTCLYRDDNSLIRCGSPADTGGNGIGIQYGPNAQHNGTVPADLAGLTNAQLADLGRRIAEENSRRLNPAHP